MSTAAEIILEYVCPSAGLLCANWMFLAPLEDVRKAALARSLGDLNPTPWAIMLGNTLGWVSYGLLRSNWFIFFGNAPGFLLSIYFNVTAIKVLYAATLQEEQAVATGSTETDDDMANVAAEEDPSPPQPPNGVDPETKTTNDTTPGLGSATSRLVFLERAILAMILLWMGVLSCVIAAESWDDDLRQMVVGLVVNCNLVFFYGAPLSIIRQVLVTRSSRWLHGPTMLRNTANGIFWAAYGFAVLDWYVAVPNTMGALLGGIQMVLWVIFPRVSTGSAESHESDEATRPA